MAKGLIFNIEEFGVHDGPGIRKLVFFKGCPLKCKWCHNPEGLSFEKELWKSHASCIKCGKCDEVCKNPSCTACGECVEYCPVNARKIVGKEYEAEELASLLLKGKEILISSGGGITISGGEPLAQPEFLYELIKHLKPIHIAIETSGYAPETTFKKIISEVDLVLMDIKHTDSTIHKKFTGVENRQILRNLRILKESGTDFYIRIPLIPGVNDTTSNIEYTLNLIKDSDNLKMVELLPYHQTAGAKYRMVGREYDPGFETSLQANPRLEIFKTYNINARIL